MKKLELLLNHIYNINYSLTPSETMIVQRQRNELKYNLLEAFVEVLIEAGIPDDLIHRTADGYIFELQNLVHGRIPIEIDVKVKNMDYIVEDAIDEWQAKIAAQKDKEAKRIRQEQEKERKRLEKEALDKQRKERIMKEYAEYKNKSENEDL